jgi:hypothetical protein
MLKRTLITIAVVSLLALSASAGEVKVYDPWPTIPEPQDVGIIDVVLDVGYYVRIEPQQIKVHQDEQAQDPFHTYTGCGVLDLWHNFACQISIASVTATSAADGIWTATIDGMQSKNFWGAGQKQTTICATGTGVLIENLVGGTPDQKVAEILLQVIPL